MNDSKLFTATELAPLENALTLQIKVELTRQSMDQKDLADAVGIERATLSRYMTGRRSMPMPTFFKVAEALGVAAHVLLERAGTSLGQY